MENTINDIKKVLYKEKPIAKVDFTLNGCDDSIYVYTAHTSLGEHKFSIRVSEMGEKIFEEQIPAQLLIRWLIP